MAPSWALILLASLAGGAAVAWALPAGPGRARTPSAPRPRGGDPTTDRPGLLRRWRGVWTLCAGAGAMVVVGGPLALPAGLAAGVGTWIAAGRLEPPALRRRREEVRRDLPHVVSLLASALAAGAAPAAAVVLVTRALPGAAADRLSPLAARLELGADPALLWQDLADDPELGPLGRTMARAHRSGAPVVGAVERLGAELAERARGDVEDRARAVGVRAAVPLGVCLLPSFLLLGIVPLVAGLAAALAF